MTVTKADLEQRLASAHRRVDREHKRAAAANIEAEALRREVRTMRLANFILKMNIDNAQGSQWRVRYEKVAEALQIIREVAGVEANGIPDATPTTLEPWLGPRWARPRPALPGTDKENS